MERVWVFNGGRNHFPSAVFTTLEAARAWIADHQLPGALTACPLDVGEHDRAAERGFFRRKREEQRSPRFITNSSSASQEHYHYNTPEE